MILHIPHAARTIPADERDGFVCDDAALERELLRSTDAFTDELFEAPDAVRIVFPVSRLVVDPERFLDETQEPMAARGRGVVYTRTVDGRPLARIRDEGVAAPSSQHTWSRDAPIAVSWEQIRLRRITRYYTPHHQRLERAVAHEVALRGSALIIDCHSFPSKPWEVESDPDAPRPDFCIGADLFHTPREIIDQATAFVRTRGYSVEINRPYAGTIVPIAFYQKESRVASIMIEVRRDLYMDESTGEKKKTFAECRDVLKGLLKKLDVWK